MEALLASLFYVLWRGIAIGIMISAPMGPVGMLCIQRTLSKGRLTGLYTGIGASASDLIYCLLTGFGLSFIEDFLTRNQNVIQLLGSGVLIGFAVYLLRKNPVASLRAHGEGDVSTPHKDILGGFLFTFSNPLILFLIIGLFARFNFLDSGLKWYNYILGYLSIAAGALAWWWLVTWFVNKVRAHFNVRSMWLINRIIGVVILIFGLVGLVTGISAIASASERFVSGNPERGFSEWGHDISGSPLTLSGGESAQVSLYEIEGAESAPFVLSWRCAIVQGDSPLCLELRGDSGILLLELTVSRPDRRDPFAADATLRARISATDSRNPESGYRLITEGMLDKADTGKGPNRFRLHREGNQWSLTGGNRPGGKALNFSHDIDPGLIRFIQPTGGVSRIDNILLSLSPSIEAGRHTMPDSLLSLARRATAAGDPLAGVWQVYDRTLDEALLRSGGDYRLCILPDTAGWTGYYLSGAKTRRELWQTGMVKTRLRPTPFDDRYDVEWRDAEGLPMTRDISAALDGEQDILTILFPYQQSELRLRRLPLP